jgi:hypothetical protein
MSGIDRTIRLSTAAAVLAVAGIAAYVSYWHAYAVVRAYGETGITAQAMITASGDRSARHSRPLSTGSTASSSWPRPGPGRGGCGEDACQASIPRAEAQGLPRHRLRRGRWRIAWGLRL